MINSEETTNLVVPSNLAGNASMTDDHLLVRSFLITTTAPFIFREN